METANCYFAALDEREEVRSSFPGLIGEEQLHRHELHGCEVDIDGRLVVPQLTPDSHPPRTVGGPGPDAEIRDRLRRICVERSPDSIDRFFYARAGAR